MTWKYFNYFKYRNFSESRISENVDKSKVTEFDINSSYDALKKTHKPSNFDKRVLVWSGKYKSVESVPESVSFTTLGNARSLLRIKIANYMMLGSLFIFGFYIWLGKKRAKSGDSPFDREKRKSLELLAEGKKKRV